MPSENDYGRSWLCPLCGYEHELRDASHERQLDRDADDYAVNVVRNARRRGGRPAIEVHGQPRASRRTDVPAPVTAPVKTAIVEVVNKQLVEAVNYLKAVHGQADKHQRENDWATGDVGDMAVNGALRTVTSVALGLLGVEGFAAPGKEQS